jgi:hypothetical protein
MVPLRTLVRKCSVCNIFMYIFGSHGSHLLGLLIITLSYPIIALQPVYVLVATF